MRFLVVGIVLVALSAHAAATFEDDIRSLENFLGVDPAVRAKSSLERGDLRLLGVRGFALDIPGVAKHIEWCDPIRSQVNVIEGTSDVVGGERHIKLIKEARTYAARYNAVIAGSAHFKVPGECKPTAAIGSTCFGTVAKGRLEGGIALPSSGPNFSAYSSLGESLGRTHVHSVVRDVVANAYRALETAAPGKVYVFGESGWKDGGSIKPHRTHQNGLSIDFMVPVVNKAGKSVPLPTGPMNKFGYDIEFDGNATFDGLTIDFDALTEHLYQLHGAARSKGIDLALVIFDEPYLPRLFATTRGPFLKQNLKFMRGKPWVRHDEHYHVDFAIACKPLT